MKYILKYNELTEFKDTEDGYLITSVKVDDRHEYEYCDGVLYELSGGDEKIISIDEIEHTTENIFYENQVENYINYIENGGILETFPVHCQKICDNVVEMLDYLEDVDNFDFTHDILKNINNYGFDLYMSGDLYKIYMYPEEYGFDEDTDFEEVSDVGDLPEPKEDYMEVYYFLQYIIEIFEDKLVYTLTNNNHRLLALKKLGKKYVYVDIYS